MKKRLPVWSFSKVNTDALEANRGYVELDREYQSVQLLPGHRDTQTVLLLAPISANGLPDLDHQFRIVVDFWGDDASMNDATQIGFVNRVTTFESLSVEDDL